MPIQKITREEIIRRSLPIFKTQGYHKTTMADIAGACGLLKGSIYHYFKSKEELMLNVLFFLNSYYEAKVFSVRNANLSAEEKIEYLIGRSEEIFKGDGNGCLMASIGLETNSVVQSFKEITQQFFNNWMNCFHEIYKTRFPEEKARDLAEAGVAEIEGSLMLMQVFDDGSYLDRSHDRIRKSINA